MNSSDKIKTLFGQRVRELRLQAGLSQEALADKSGLDRTYISGIERGVRNPTLVVIIILSGALNIGLTTLFSIDMTNYNK